LNFEDNWCYCSAHNNWQQEDYPLTFTLPNKQIGTSWKQVQSCRNRFRILIGLFYFI